MKGTIHIIDSKESIGKVLFDDGRESLVQKFPDTFEAGDKAEVKFYKNDPSEKIINILIPGEEWNYGFIKIPHRDKPFGSILPTYPKIRSLIFYHKNDLKFIKSDSLYGFAVKFKIKKTFNGKVSAIDITKVGKKDIHKCKTPIFGTLEVKKEKVQTGFVKTLVKIKTGSNTTFSGKISAIMTKNEGEDNEHTFGFIKRDDGNSDIYFNENAFTKFYKRKSVNGDRVNFTTRIGSKGIQLKSFCKPYQEELLPQKDQYGYLEVDSKSKKKIRFSLSEYIDFYKREPEEGDLVCFYEGGNKFEFKKDENEIIEKNILKRKKDEISNITEGTITNCLADRGFGFIKVKNETYTFLISTYKKTFDGKDPVKNDKVKFITKIADNGKTVVGKFIRLQPDQINCPKESFKNFVEIDNNSLYYVYTANNQKADEIYKLNANIKSEAISCYKDRNIAPRFKLEAIEALLKFNYSDKNIKKNTLLNEKKEILNILQKKEFQNRDFLKALDYENELQQMDYQPLNLSKFENMQSDFTVKKMDYKKIKELSFCDDWNLSFGESSEIEDIAIKEQYLIAIDDKVEPIEELECNEKWALEFTLKDKLKNSYTNLKNRFLGDNK